MSYFEATLHVMSNLGLASNGLSYLLAVQKPFLRSSSKMVYLAAGAMEATSLKQGCRELRFEKIVFLSQETLAYCMTNHLHLRIQ